jgi:hypothetical protein
MALIKSVKGKKFNKVKAAILIEGISANYVMHFS